MKFDLGKIVFLVLVLIALTLGALIYGAAPEVISALNSAVYVIVMILLCFIILYVAKFALEKVLAWVDEGVTDGRQSSLYPILSMLIDLVVILSFVYVILSSFGIDILVIVTSLGIVGLAITFGAQSTLQQFFSGIGLMMSHSIRTGDVVRLNGQPTRLTVKSIGTMTTTFTSMESPETIVMPNNAVSGATVYNMTADADSYCVNILMGFHAGTRDLEEVAKLLVQAAEGVPHVVTDGSLPRPFVQFKYFKGGNVETMLLAYIDDVHLYDFVSSDLVLAVYKILRENGMLPNEHSSIRVLEAN